MEKWTFLNGSETFEHCRVYVHVTVVSHNWGILVIRGIQSDVCSYQMCLLMVMSEWRGQYRGKVRRLAEVSQSPTVVLVLVLLVQSACVP